MVGATLMKFLADRNVGNLSRWLRLLGLDATFAEDKSDSDILMRALQEGRILLTRDRGLVARTPKAVYLVKSANPREQLKEIIAHFKLKRLLKPFSRCVECNVVIRMVAKTTVKGKVPPRVFAQTKVFYQCPSCKKVFWEGSHTRRAGAVIQKIVGESPARDDKMGAEEKGE